MKIIIAYFGWRDALLITSGLTLCCCLVAALFKPVPEEPTKPLLLRIKEERDDARSKWESEPCIKVGASVRSLASVKQV